MLGSPSRRLRLAGVWVCVWLSGCAVAWAQTGGVRVDVLDAETRQALPGATVTLSNQQGLITPTSGRTDTEGRIEFPVLQVGSNYTIEVALPGFGTQRRSQLSVNSGRVLPIVVSLGRPMQETVEVYDASRIVELDDVGARTKFSNEFIEGLPQRGRQYQSILPLAPGVLDNDDDGNPNVHGARTRDFRAEISGVSNVDPLTGKWLSRVNADSIQELEVVPVAAGVEFGRAQGGFARILQKQGTNEFEGTFNLLYQSSWLDGDGAGNTDRTSETEFETLQPALHLAGPLIRDKLWYRFSNEYIKKEDPLNLLGTTAATTTEQLVLANQITWQMFPRHKLAFQLQYDPIKQGNLDISSAVLPESSFGLERDGYTASVTWTGPLSPRLLVTGLVALQNYSNDILPTDENAVQRCAPFTGIPSLNTARCLDLDSDTISGAWPSTSLDERQRLSTRLQATFYRRLGSHSHQIKLGLVAESERYDRELTRRPSMSYKFEPARGIGGDDLGLADVRVPAPLVSQADAVADNWALYFEDQWKPRNNLNVTFGLRLDQEQIVADGTTPIDMQAESREYYRLLEELRAAGGLGDDFEAQLAAGEGAFTVYEDFAGLPERVAVTLGIDPSRVGPGGIVGTVEDWSRQRQPVEYTLENTNWSPRLSLAWDPWSDGNTKLSFSAGRYYDKIFLAVPLVGLEPVEAPMLMQAEWQGSTNIPLTVERSSFRIGPLIARTVDPNLRTPYQDEYSFAVERAIGTETSVKLSYIRRQFRDQLQDVDLNHVGGDYGLCTKRFFTPWPTNTTIAEGLIVDSYGAGQPIYDNWTGEEYIDTDPGRGDGRVDDCFGTQQVAGTEVFPYFYEIPDGLPDPYTQNPTWEEIFVVGNFNTTDYEAIVLELVRRQYRNWEYQASYTYSKAEGDAEDFNLLLGNEPNLREDERGFLSYDQRHVVKLNAAFLTHNGYRFGVAAVWQSGLPYSIVSGDASSICSPFYPTSACRGFQIPPDYPFGTVSTRPRLRYPTGQRNDQRNPAFLNVDLLVAKQFMIGRSVVGQVSGEVFNVFNDDTLALLSRSTGNSGRISGTRRFGRRFQLGLKLSF